MTNKEYFNNPKNLLNFIINNSNEANTIDNTIDYLNTCNINYNINDLSTAIYDATHEELEIYPCDIITHMKLTKENNNINNIIDLYEYIYDDKEDLISHLECEIELTKTDIQTLKERGYNIEE